MRAVDRLSMRLTRSAFEAWRDYAASRKVYRIVRGSGEGEEGEEEEEGEYGSSSGQTPEDQEPEEEVQGELSLPFTVSYPLVLCPCFVCLPWAGTMGTWHGNVGVLVHPGAAQHKTIRR